MGLKMKRAKKRSLEDIRRENSPDQMQAVLLKLRLIKKKGKEAVN